MGINTKASDWEVLGVCQVGGADGLGAGIWFFDFKSRTANVKEMFNFTAGLGGIGGSIGGAPGDLTGPYTRINCAQPFSLNELDGSGGVVLNGGGSFMAGYSAAIIGASKFAVGGGLFMNQFLHGVSIGIGLGVVWGFGLWSRMTISKKKY